MSTAVCRDDAAYLLGALSPSDRRTFESHLAECADCRRSVRELAGLPGLMAKVAPDDFASAAEPPPATLLATLTAAVRRERVRRLRRIGGLAAAAAVGVLLVTFGIRALVSSNSAVDGTAMSSVSETPVEARAELTATMWGTRIDLLCSYEQSPAYGRQPRTYSLVVTDRAGVSEQVATWRVVPHGVSRVTGSTAWRRSDITRVEIRTPDGTPVLRLNT